MVACLVRDQEAVGSNPATRTIGIRKALNCWKFKVFSFFLTPLGLQKIRKEPRGINYETTSYLYSFRKHLLNLFSTVIAWCEFDHPKFKDIWIFL